MRSSGNILLLVVLLLSKAWGEGGEDVTRFVNPFIGTAGGGNTFPGAVVPWGMVSVSPHTSLDAPSGYIHGEKWFYGFGHTHLSGTGCADLGGVILVVDRDAVHPSPESYRCTYSEEKAAPGYYSVVLREPDVLAEVTASVHCGVTRFTPRHDGELRILLDAGRSLALVGGGSVTLSSSGEISGYNTSGGFCGEANRQRVYFSVRLDHPIDAGGIWVGRSVTGDSAATSRDSSVGAWVTVPAKRNESILVKVGISYVSIENARQNLRSEVPDWNFERVQRDAQTQWQNALSRVRVDGGTTGDRTKFYTALYHALIHPSIISDVNGEYPLMGRNGVGKYNDRNRYNVFSLWDTYRTLHPLLTLLYPERQSEMVGTMIDMYRESGWLPKWELAGNETHMMAGDPAAIVIADSYVKGITDFDLHAAYEAMVKPAEHAGEREALPARPGYQEYLRYGYIPFDQDTSKEWWVWGPASVTLEYCLADWSIARVAERMRRRNDADTFLSRSQYYRNLFDTETGFIRPKRVDGSWLVPFDPRATEGSGSWAGSGGPGYVEGNAWQYTWSVPHDVAGIIGLFGGSEAFARKLDSGFALKQFTMNNEPDIAYPYLYTYVPGKEYRAGEIVRSIMDTLFGTGPDGLPGNDDCGAISAWFVFSALGFYPVCPASDEYRIGIPLFPKTSFELRRPYYSGGEFTIETRGRIQRSPSTELNGQPLKAHRVLHKDIINGGRLAFMQ